MPKVVRVIKKYFCFVAVIISSSVYSQNILEGRFNNKGYFFEFYSDNTFEYREANELGLGGYGKGHYILTKDSLVLNYDLTNIEIEGYHILKPYLNFKDSIRIDIKVYDFHKNNLQNADILFFGEKEIIEKKTNQNGHVNFYFEKNLKKNIVQVIYGDFSIYVFELNFDICYEIEVYISKKPEYNIGRAIKNTTQKYKILKNKHNHYIKLQDSKGSILTLKKVAKGYYTNDPFEE